MRKDTKTFLSAVLGIPLALCGAWGFNAASEASVVVFEREHAAIAEPEVLQPVEIPAEEVVPAKQASEPIPVPVKAEVQPAIIPAPAPTVPVVPAPVTVAPTPEPAPKPVPAKKSRRTRAS